MNVQQPKSSKSDKGKAMTQRVKKKPINAVSKVKDWAWKPEDKDIPEIKFARSKKSKSRGKRKNKRQKVTKLQNEDFYSSKDWRKLRVRVLERYQCSCMMCGRSPKAHKIVLHVDHIKPRSKFPELSLTFDNLQILCEDCNLGKSNKYDTDWRPDDLTDHDRELLLSSPL